MAESPFFEFDTADNNRATWAFNKATVVAITRDKSPTWVGDGTFWYTITMTTVVPGGTLEFTAQYDDLNDRDGNYDRLLVELGIKASPGLLV